MINDYRKLLGALDCSCFQGDKLEAALRETLDELDRLRGRYEYVRDYCLDGAMMLNCATPEQRDQRIDAMRGEEENPNA